MQPDFVSYLYLFLTTYLSWGAIWKQGLPGLSVAKQQILSQAVIAETGMSTRSQIKWVSFRYKLKVYGRNRRESGYYSALELGHELLLTPCPVDSLGNRRESTPARSSSSRHKP